jgi:hypothetical protein
VKALLDGEAELGRELFAEFRDHYPIVLTRSMRAARRWIRRQRRGTERAGLVASSSAQRLKPHAIDIRVNIDPVHWFLSPPRDTRSSLYLEDAATEFQVQGLEPMPYVNRFGGQIAGLLLRRRYCRRRGMVLPTGRSVCCSSKRCNPDGTRRTGGFCVAVSVALNWTLP